MKVTSVALLVLCISGCAGIQNDKKVAGEATPSRSAIQSYPDSLHWYRDSAEQKAAYIQTYRAATTAAEQLSQGLASGSWGVILDVDETLLDNSDFQKRLALTGEAYESKTWNLWVEERRATALPGAKEFLDTVQRRLKGKVVLVTNRTAQQCLATEENLRKQELSYDKILCDAVGDGDKNPRFATVIAGTPTGVPPVNILVWVGDNIQDFPSLSQTSADFALMGAKYFVLPNPMYGSWTKNRIR